MSRSLQNRATESHSSWILQPGRNCWRVEKATRAKLLPNSHYFRALAESLARARRSILIMGWDFDARLILDPERGGGAGLPLIQYLCRLLDAEKDLEIRILLWNRTILYGGNHKSATALKRARRQNDRLFYRYRSGGFAASRHTKLVCVDDEIAFIGGIDLTGRRWDHDDHPAWHPRRVTPDGEAYGPIHDLQMLVEGPAAGVLSEHACAHWQNATGEVMRVEAPTRLRGVWPPHVDADFRNIPIGIARTEAERGYGNVREIEALNRAALMAARHCIYIETQYLTSEAVGDALIRRLSEPQGPEIVVIVTRASGGYLEQFTMGNNRDRLLHRLAAADRWGRLRVYYPVVRHGATQLEMKVHAKLIIIDDRFLRVGSSNLNNRSMAVDSECDVALEASDAESRAHIAAIRNRLIAEQLHCRPTEIAAAICDTKSLIESIEAMDQGKHLQRLCAPKHGSHKPMPGTAILDPRYPIDIANLWRRVAGTLFPTVAGVRTEFHDGERHEADSKRHQEIETAERDKRSNRIDVRQ
jgi:phosphatidylserine/phosphatidylglycerophosphate/cardiolipin synthase-like enzyme